MSGIALLITFVIAIIIMIIAISKWNIHPLLAILGVSLMLAIVTEYYSATYQGLRCS